MAICTYNVDGINADTLKKTDSITKMFEEMITNDIIVINLQEVDMSLNKLFSSKLDGKFILWKDYLYKIFKNENFYSDSWALGTIMMNCFFNRKASNYIKYYEIRGNFLGEFGPLLLGNKAAIALHVIYLKKRYILTLK